MPYKKITIQYKNGKVTALNAPYNTSFISEIKSVQTASYDVRKKAWSCHERFGLVLEALVSKHFGNYSVPRTNSTKKELEKR